MRYGGKEGNILVMQRGGGWVRGVGGWVGLGTEAGAGAGVGRTDFTLNDTRKGNYGNGCR